VTEHQQSVEGCRHHFRTWRAGGGRCYSRAGTMRWTQESLGRIRAIVMIAIGALILVAYILSRRRGSW